MAPDAEIYDYRVFHEILTPKGDGGSENPAMGGQGSGETAGKRDADNLIKEAVEHATKEGVDIINMSFTRRTSIQLPSYQEAIEAAAKAGVIIICAAGDGDGDITTDEE